MLLSIPFVISHKLLNAIPKITCGWPAAANTWLYFDKLVSINIDFGMFLWATGGMPPILKPVKFLHSSASAFIAFELKILDIFSKETNLSPETKHRWK